VGASENVQRASEGIAIIGAIADRSSERPKRGYNEMGGRVIFGLSEADRGGGTGHRKEKESREGSRTLLSAVRMGCKGTSNSSAIFEKCHRKYDVL
jgi:hypothetical protein